ncbi:MAG: CD3324 family protein [Eubacteriales bacterium]|nr:CD3324 family protein [Eubacteriales bacterium]
MRYIKAEDILPSDVLETVQQYIDGAMLYIPKRKPRQSEWGAANGAKEYYARRNALIISDFMGGMRVRSLAEKYCLAEKSIQRIVRNAKPSCVEERSGGFEHEP